MAGEWWRNPGLVIQFIKAAQEAELSARAALARFREVGGQIATETWFKMYRAVAEEDFRRATWLRLGARDVVDDPMFMSGRPGMFKDEWPYNVKVRAMDTRTGEVFETWHYIGGRRAATKGEIIREAMRTFGTRTQRYEDEVNWRFLGVVDVEIPGAATW